MHIPLQTAVSAAIRVVIITAIVALIGHLAWPWFKNAMYVSELLREEAPRSLPIPVQGVSMRNIRDTFGAPRPGDRKHQGVDIFAPRGTPVLSTTRGIVSRLGEDSLGGTVVWVLGPAGDHHYYAHLDRVAELRTGQRIAAGDVLGTVGNTGNARSTPPHLHYGIYRWLNGAINPFTLLAAEPASRASSDAQRDPGKGVAASAP